MGIPQDLAQALHWYGEAVEQGDAGALQNLGEIYSKGLGVRRNRVVGYALYDAAAARDPSAENFAPGLPSLAGSPDYSAWMLASFTTLAHMSQSRLTMAASALLSLKSAVAP